MNALRGPAAAFSTQTPDPADQRHPTIGHIGRYALKHRLGEGGLGTVYAAHDPLLSRLIAVKTLNVEIDENDRAAFNAMFLNEARAAAGLNHTHIVTVFDAGISDNRAYIAMELLKGRDLRQLRREGWRPTPAQAALIVRRVADALGYAHSKGVVHRDVKPANIFMIGRAQPKVLDFGIARIAHQHDVHGADAELAAGSPYYMAPEQARQEPVDRRADVFSLGVVLYEMLTDVKPFRGDTLDEITNAVLTHEPPLANVVDPQVPAALAEIAAKAMAKSPEHRYRSARAFARELRHWLEENTNGANDGDAPIETSPRSRRAWIAAGVIVASVLGGLIWAAMTSQPEAPVAPAAPVLATRPAAAVVAAPAPVVPAPPPALVAAAPVVVPPAASAAVASEAASAAPVERVAAPVVPAVVKAPPAAKAPTAIVLAPKETPKETPKERRAREARERDARLVAATVVAPPAPVARGLVRIAISPWGDVEVDGKPAGTSPPVTELSLTEGRHQIVIRNADLPPHNAVVNVTADQPVTLKHRF
jgi:eukaryotic-like serine/threonine-protein kinase